MKSVKKKNFFAHTALAPRKVIGPTTLPQPSRVVGTVSSVLRAQSIHERIGRVFKFDF